MQVRKALAISVSINVVLAVAYLYKNAEVEAIKENRQKIHNYAVMLRDVMMEHYNNGGTLRAGPEMDMTVTAYILLAAADMG